MFNSFSNAIQKGVAPSIPEGKLPCTRFPTLLIVLRKKKKLVIMQSWIFFVLCFPVLPFLFCHKFPDMQVARVYAMFNVQPKNEIFTTAAWRWSSVCRHQGNDAYYIGIGTAEEADNLRLSIFENCWLQAKQRMFCVWFFSMRFFVLTQKPTFGWISLAERWFLNANVGPSGSVPHGLFS